MGIVHLVNDLKITATAAKKKATFKTKMLTTAVR